MAPSVGRGDGENIAKLVDVYNGQRDLIACELNSLSSLI